MTRWQTGAMPELPDITVYAESLAAKVRDDVLRRVRVASPFLLRTAVPPLGAVEGKRVTSLRRLGKRIVIGLEGDLFLVLHLMIAGRLHWQAAGGKPPAQVGAGGVRVRQRHAVLTEAGTKRRASLHLVRGPRRRWTRSTPAGSRCWHCDLADVRRAARAPRTTR